MWEACAAAWGVLRALWGSWDSGALCHPTLHSWPCSSSPWPPAFRCQEQGSDHWPGRTHLEDHLEEYLQDRHPWAYLGSRLGAWSGLPVEVQQLKSFRVMVINLPPPPPKWMCLSTVWCSSWHEHPFPDNVLQPQQQGLWDLEKKQHDCGEEF